MDIYGFSSTTLFFLLSNNVMLPIQSSSVVNGTNVYTYADPNSINYQYNFNASDMNPLGSGANGTGYFGTPTIAAPQYACNSRNAGNAFSDSFPNWLSTINGAIDLRGLYVACQPFNNTFIYKRFIPDQPTLNTTSSYLGTPVAYTTEALYYAQSGYFVTVVMVQWSNVFACKSRKVSIFIILVFFNLFRS